MLLGAEDQPLRVLWRRFGQPVRLGPLQVVPANLLLELLCLLALMVVAAVVLKSTALGDRPVTHDHTVHYFKAWLLKRFLFEGRLLGWSHLWFGGHPAQYLYPFGADLWVVLVYMLGLGLISFSTAYGVAFYLFWVLQGYAVYHLGKRSVGQLAGIAAALLYITDTGAYRYGGWIFTAEWGVWPQSLSIALGLLALSQVRAVLRRSAWRPVALFGLFMGASMLCHPVQLLHFGLLAVVISGAHLFTPWAGSRLPGLLRLGVGYGCGGAIGAIWLLPFLSVRDLATAYGEPWESAFEIGKQLLELTFLKGSLALVGALGLVGVVAALRSRRLMTSALGLLVLVLTAGATTTLLRELHLPELSDAFNYILFQRFSMLLKPYWFLLAAATAVAVVRSSFALCSGAAPPAPSVRQRFIRTLLVVTLAAPLGYGVAYHFAVGQLARQLDHDSGRSERNSYDRFVAWVEDNLVGKEDGFFRIAVLCGIYDHHLVDLGARIPYPIYKAGRTAASVFRYQMESHSVAMLRALNVRYVLTDHRPLGGEAFRKIETFGGLDLYEFLRWNPVPAEVIEGQGELTLEHIEDEEIVLTAGAGARGTLRINVSYFPRWRAFHEGEELEIQTVRVEDDEQTAFMKLPLRPGRYRLLFRRSLLDHLGSLLGLLGVVVCLLLAAPARWRSARRIHRVLDDALARSQQLIESHRRGVSIFGWVLAGGAAALVVALASWTPMVGSSAETGSATVTFDFLERLGSAEVGLDGPHNKSTFPQVLGRHIGGHEAWSHVSARSVLFEGPGWQRCIWVHPREEGPIRLRYDGVPASDAVVGYFGVAASGESSEENPVQFQIRVDGREVLSRATAADATRYDFAVPLRADEPDPAPSASAEGDDATRRVEFLVSAPHVGRRHFCFMAQTVAYGE